VSVAELCYRDASALAELIRLRELSPVEVVRAHLERIGELNPRLNAVVTLHPEAERLAADAEAAVARGDTLGPLHGVPFTIKDGLDTAGVRTTRGSLLFADHVPAADATAVARLRAAGAIPLGKTNLPEFALWWESANRVFGRTVNPWDLERTAGGSSGGEAAAIATGLSPLGLGSDLGGSIRLPASHCGIVGLKPSHGLVPLTGHFPDTITRFMHVGPMSRTVRDAALALSVLAGPDPRDPESVPAPAPRAAVEELPAGLRAGLLARGVGPVEPEVEAVVRGAAEALAEAGVAVEELDLDWLERRDTNLLTLTLYSAEAWPYFDAVIGDRVDDLHPFLRSRLGSPKPSLREYVEAEAEVDGLRRDVAALFERIDVLVLPTTPVPAHAHDLAEVRLRGETYRARAMMRATIPWDLTGSPALSVPFGLTADGLPVGVQLVGRRFEDGLVLSAGAALERLREPAELRPPLAA
jgi:aspartyl-tRNA(Asn)/glutamyl-tRNA(Gln) amidotransferase subunit A